MDFYLGLLQIIGVHTMLGLSAYCVLLTGQVSLAQAGFFAIGAYVAGMLTVLAQWPLVPSLGASAVVAGAMACAVGFPALRVKGLMLVVATIAFGEAVRLFFFNFTYQVQAGQLALGPHGAEGFRQIRYFPENGWTTLNVMLFIWAVLALVMAAVWLLDRSRAGAVLRAVGEDELAAQSSGINITAVKVSAMTIGGVIAGIGGGIFAHYTTHIEHVQFGVVLATFAIAYPILGGLSNVFGTLLAVIFVQGHEVTGDKRFRENFAFAAPEKRHVYIQRLLDTCTTTAGYKLADIMAGKYGPSGGCLLNFRTYPRIPFYEQVHDSEPFHTDTGRMHAYADVPEAIEYGENFIVHREGPEATPYLPNVIVSSNPLVRPEDYGIPVNAQHWDERTIRNIKMPWAKVKQTKNFLWEKGFQFYCLTPKTRHRVHSGWSNVDWHMLYDSNFGDPYRLDKRAPCVGEHQLNMNPQAARDLGINDGDYVYVDANPADRP